MMLTAICREIRNYFTYDEDKFFGTFEIVDGHITPSIDLSKTDYYRIAGSRKNDGVHKSSDTLKDEGKFTGSVWLMSIPEEFLELAERIEKWQETNGQADSIAMSPFTSEVFGGYSYTKSLGDNFKNSELTSWKKIFNGELNKYRKVRI